MKTREGRKNFELIGVSLFFLVVLSGLPRCDGLLDLLGPLNLAAAFVAVLSLEKNLLLAALTEETLLSL